MNASNMLLSAIVAFRTYAKFVPHLGRRESLAESINRNMNMHLDRFPKLSSDITKAYNYVHNLKVMPSMRALQFSGEAILKNHARQYNCSFTNIDNVRVFGEILYLLLSGVGVGFSVQKHHTRNLPKLKQPKENGFFSVQDSIMGWAQSIDLLMEAYFYGRVKPRFDFGDIRPKGSYLVTTGAKAPGPEPLKKMLEMVEEKLKNAIGRQLRPIELHDIICIISDAVLAGGIRRAALISLFDRDDTEMLKSKSGEWWNNFPWRARANNSAVLPRNEVSKDEFFEIFKICKESGSGEPGFSWSNNTDWGFNPCVTGETEILTSEGYQRIDELVDQPTKIWNGFEWSEVTPKITGYNQEILTINFSDGRTLNCTPYHKFHISIDYRGGTKIVEAKDLEPGMKLIKHEFPIMDTMLELEDAYTNGFVSAEGMELNKTLYVYKPKEMCLERIQNKKLVKWEENNNRYRVILNKTPLSKNFVPLDYSVNSKLEWLSGLFDGDGTELKEGGLQLVSINRDFLTNLQKLLSTLGIQCKVLFANKAGMRLMPDGKGGSAFFQCQNAYRICIGAKQMQNLKSLGLKCERMSFEKTPQRDASQFVSVVDITENGFAEKVYCFNEPKRHMGIFNGVLTGQCHEIALNSNQFCNLTTINQTDIKSEKDFLNRVYQAALLGTLQASYTNFDYLRPSWQITTERESLLGVSFTGIADSKSMINAEMLKKASQLVLDVNEKYSKKIGINLAARTTTIKPEGTSSCVLGSSSGIHARHAQHYIRRIRMNKDDSLAVYLKNTIPSLVEDDIFSSTGVVVSIPQESPNGAILRENETALSLFNRTLYYSRNWVNPGHRYGDNKHNVSVTISVKDNEWEDLRNQMWENRDLYSGISLLPYDGGNYQQAPFEECSKEKYEEMSKQVKDIDLKQVKEETDNTARVKTVACSGGACEIV
jgi:ribonucleotide reductase alpha subunit